MLTTQSYQRQAAGAGHGRLQVYLEDFAGLIQNYIETYRAPFTSDEGRLLQGQDLATLNGRVEYVLELATKLLRERFRSQVRGSIRGGLGFNGSWIGGVNGYTLWFGVNLGAWREHGLSPFWIQHEGPPAHAWGHMAKERGLPAAYHRRSRDEFLVPVVLDIGPTLEVSASLLAVKATDIMTAMSDALGSSGVPSTSSAITDVVPTEVREESPSTP